MGEVSYPRSRPRTRPLLLRDPVPNLTTPKPDKSDPGYRWRLDVGRMGRISLV